jgi:polyphosphate kinase 2
VTKGYREALTRLQLALVRWQVAAMEAGQKTAIVFEGRDAAGKDGTIRRIVKHLSVRNSRVVALSKPSDRDRTLWYFQRYAAHLPGGGELVIFNRSWYNRAGVERVMEFSTPGEQEAFLSEAPRFEAMLTGADIALVKIWLDVSKDEQARRLADRAKNPLKALKSSPLDAYAQPRWEAYSKARNEMLRRTHTDHAPWICVNANDKKAARLNVMRHLIQTLASEKVAAKVDKPDPNKLFAFEIAAIEDGRLAK